MAKGSGKSPTRFFLLRANRKRCLRDGQEFLVCGIHFQGHPASFPPAEFLPALLHPQRNELGLETALSGWGRGV